MLYQRKRVRLLNYEKFWGDPNFPGLPFQSPASSNKLQSFMNNMGGIDGLLAKIENAQKFVKAIAPVLPLLGSLLTRKKRPYRTKLNRGGRSTIKNSSRPIAYSHKNRPLRKKASP